MLLCPTHHHEATVGAMLKEEQRRYKEHPYNIERGFVEGQLKINQKTPVVNIGSNQFIGNGDFLLVDGENLLSIQVNKGRVELSIKLHDQKDNLVVEIKRNEWVSGNPLPWDLESKFQWIRIRRKLRDIGLEVDARKYPIDVRADMWRKGQNFQLKPNEVLFNGVKTNVGFKNLCFVALRLEANTSKQTFSIVPDPRFGSGHLVALPNLRKRIRVGLLAWEKLSCKHEFVNIIDRKKYTVTKCSKCGKIEKTWK